MFSRDFCDDQGSSVCRQQCVSQAYSELEGVSGQPGLKVKLGREGSQDTFQRRRITNNFCGAFIKFPGG